MNSEPMRILMVLLNLEVGGLERIVADLALSLQRRGHDVRVLALRGGGPMAAELASAGVGVKTLDLADGLKLSHFRAVSEVLATEQPDVVHSHGEAALCYVGIPASVRRRFVHVHTRHGYEDVSWRGRLRNRMAHRGCDAVVCVSEDLTVHCREVEKVAARRLSTIVNGVNLSAYRELAPASFVADAPVVCHVARLVRIKNQELLLEAFAALQAMWPNARLDMVGDGPERNNLEASAEALGIAARVSFHGEVTDVCARLSEAHLFCLSSDSEGTPVSVLEALAGGRPVISTDVGGIRAVVPPDGGRLVPPGDREALAGALRDMYANAETYAAAVRAARGACLNDVEAMAAEYLRLYRPS